MLPVPEQNRVTLEQEDLVCVQMQADTLFYCVCVFFIMVKPAGMESPCSHNGH